MGTSSASGRNLFTKGRAILAGGLVLGVGAVVTLAAWNDSEFATGEFGAGEFSIEGSTDGSTFSEHATSDAAATLNFEVNADNLTPGDAVYANYSVQLTSNSNYAADVTVTPTVEQAADNFTVGYVYTTSATCDAAAFAAGTDANVASFSLAAVETPTNLCIQVSASETLDQGETGSVTFEFVAESTDSL